MITKTYICDKCNKSVGENELIPVSVEVKLPARVGSNYRRSTECKKELCKSCLVKVGIIVEVPESEKEETIQAKNIKTLEAKFIEILEELGVNFVE